MTGRAGVAIWIGHVALMIWAIRILPIPACREAYADHDTSRARLRREVQGLTTSGHGGLQACEVHILVLGL